MAGDTSVGTGSGSMGPNVGQGQGQGMGRGSGPGTGIGAMLSPNQHRRVQVIVTCTLRWVGPV